jgi:Peroxisomal membrane protein (Pex16)
MIKLLESYKRFVRGHASAVGSLELVLPWLTWLLPDRFASSEMPAEVINSISGILSIVHDGALEPDSPQGASLYLALLQQVRIALDARRRTRRRIPDLVEQSGQIFAHLCILSTISWRVQLEVLIEMASVRLEHAGVLRSKYSVLVALEGVKCGPSPLRKGHDARTFLR